MAAFADNLSDTSDDDDNNLFSHSARNFSSIVAERTFRAKTDKTGGVRTRPKGYGEPKLSRKRKSDKVGEDSDNALGGYQPTTKRERSNTPPAEDETSFLTFDNIASSKISKPSVLSLETNPAAIDPILQAQQEDHLRKQDPSDLHEAPTFYALKTAKAAESQNDDSDDEFAEVARKARLEARQKRQDKASQDKVEQSVQPSYRPPIEAEPKVEIFLSSNMPDTTPLRVFLRLSQHLGMVRSVWCQRQNFPPEVANMVYLTYRGRRVYDVSTCRSLGLDTDSYGQLVMRGAQERYGIDKIHLEAVTDEFLVSQRVQRWVHEASEATVATIHTTDVKVEDDASEQQVRIILRARGLPDFKVKVRTNTTIARITAACRKNWSLDESKNITLEFDGDELPPEQEIKDTEISDKDQLEVHVR